MFFFFKQKTAYDMRISDWSSDVCSSDLLRTGRRPSGVDRTRPRLVAPGGAGLAARTGGGWRTLADRNGFQLRAAANGARMLSAGRGRAGRCAGLLGLRSEEHTSELQSLMRISYAVFCLKKKINNKHLTHAK